MVLSSLCYINVSFLVSGEFYVLWVYVWLKVMFWRCGMVLGFGVVYVEGELLFGKGLRGIYFNLKVSYFKWGWVII